MIDRDYCVMMARYNAWQNRQLDDLLEALDPAELTADRKGFFGSILGTLNHLLWGDLMWISRFDGGPAPDGTIPDSPARHPTLGTWQAERFRTDGRIKLWADRLNSVDLKGNLEWYSGAIGRQMSMPMQVCVVHFFNHQTHHRGQVHAMLTAAGSKAPVTDIPFMPESF